MNREPDNPSRHAFSLIELLLVVVLLGIVLGVTLPAFMRSFQGHRLRTAARATAMVARYARSMSVLKQCNLVLRFNMDSGQVALISTTVSLPSFSRSIERVALASVDIEGEDPRTEGVCDIPYYRNGTCRPFSVTIRDPGGNTVVLKVDALSSVRAMEFSEP